MYTSVSLSELKSRMRQSKPVLKNLKRRVIKLTILNVCYKTYSEFRALNSESGAQHIQEKKKLILFTYKLL